MITSGNSMHLSHCQVVKIKKEINWDDEEKKHWEMVEERNKLADAISSDEEEDFKPHTPFRCVTAAPLLEYPSGMESGYLGDCVPLDHSRGYEYVSGLESDYVRTNHQLHEECPSGLESGYALEQDRCSESDWSRPGHLVDEDCLPPTKRSEDCLLGFESGYFIEECGTEFSQYTRPMQHRKRRATQVEVDLAQHRKRSRVAKVEVVKSKYQITVSKKRKFYPRTPI